MSYSPFRSDFVMDVYPSFQDRRDVVALYLCKKLYNFIPTWCSSPQKDKPLQQAIDMISMNWPLIQKNNENQLW